ncbi:MAG: hypothetical protein ACOZIN_20270 [Myxococcota bacterium]
MKTLLGVAALLLPAAAGAQARRMEGVGRITAYPGWRLTPNDYFYDSASRAGHDPERPSLGGPQVTGSFAYAATDEIEVGIDLFGGAETLRLSGMEPIGSTTYGGLIGVRLQKPGLFFDALVPSFGVHTGPALILVSSRSLERPHEVLTTAYAATAGFTVRLGERWGLSLEYKLLLARGMVPHISGVNGGGHWLSVGFTTYFPSEPGSETGFRRF